MKEGYFVEREVNLENVKVSGYYSCRIFMMLRIFKQYKACFKSN